MMMKPDELQDLYDDLLTTHQATISRECAIELLETILHLTDELRKVKK